MKSKGNFLILMVLTSKLSDDSFDIVYFVSEVTTTTSFHGWNFKIIYIKVSTKAVDRMYIRCIFSAFVALVNMYHLDIYTMSHACVCNGGYL